MLNNIKNFIDRFKKDTTTLGPGFNLDNIRVVLICGYGVPKYMKKYRPDREKKGGKEEDGKEEGEKQLDAFFEENKEIKRDNFFILNVDDLKRMYGPTFQLVWESILNEPFESTTTSSTVNKN